MKLFYSNPFPRSTPSSKKFSRNRRFRSPVKYSDKLQRSQKRIRLCVRIIRIDLVNPDASTLSSEEPWRHAIYWRPWLVPLIGIKKDRDRDPNEKRDPRISAASASYGSEARPNQVPAGLRICRFRDRLSTPERTIGRSVAFAIPFSSKKRSSRTGCGGRTGAGGRYRTRDV
jgi:hypothetical protein